MPSALYLRQIIRSLETSVIHWQIAMTLIWINFVLLLTCTQRSLIHYLFSRHPFNYLYGSQFSYIFTSSLFSHFPILILIWFFFRVVVLKCLFIFKSLVTCPLSHWLIVASKPLIRLLLIGITHVVCGAGSMKRHGVRPSVCVSSNPLLQVCCCGPGGQEIAIDSCSSGVRMRAVPRCQRT